MNQTIVRLFLLGWSLWMLAACEAPSSPGGSGMCAMGEGYTVCSREMFGYGTTCCGGREISFADGPCFPRSMYDAGPIDPGMGDPGMSDAGMVDAGGPCDADPTANGCPCTTEGEIACRSFTWRGECRGGVWTTAYGYVCC